MSILQRIWHRIRSGADGRNVVHVDSTFEWRYEPTSDGRDANSPFELSQLPSPDRKFLVERQRTELGHVPTAASPRIERQEAKSSAVVSAPSEGGAGDLASVPAPVTLRDELGVGAEQLRRQLDDQLVRWWSDGAIPSRTVLRDGLLALEAGYQLDESQRALLLRAALHHGKGLATAIRYHDNPALSAVLIAESIVNPDHPLPLEALDALLADEALGADLQEHVAQELYLQGAVAGGNGRRLASAGLSRCGYGDPHEEPRKPDASAQMSQRAPMSLLHGRRRRILAFFATIAVVVLTATWAISAQTEAGSVRIPGGRYMVGGAGESTRAVSLSEYHIDRLEVTNAQYRRCFQRGACRRPTEFLGLSHQGVFSDRFFDDHPVTNVSLDDASAYCAWVRKRLPTADEWEAAASAAVASGRQYRYPWGDHFDVRLANSIEAGVGGTLAVGSKRPAGNSPTGVADMAGNVAEWTSTAADAAATLYVVKGGSYQDGAAELQASAVALMPENAREAWLGFRCAQSSTIVR